MPEPPESKITLACKEACRDIASVVIERKAKGQPVSASEILSVALQRLLSYKISGPEWTECIDYLNRHVEDEKWKALVHSPTE